ncbi:hypothetical protein VNO78_28799 [Psophocarpus tetragonolobus]|uniref:EF-hand domain-containing protein n=1 Tax=Psophocarpus tetragonolobus TaxID=3891 RepID=A0AAN9WYY1_PSOTE
MPVIIPNSRIIIGESDIRSKGVGADDDVVEKIMKKLREADGDKDGRYNKNELKSAMRNLGALFPGWRAQRCLANADLNNDGLISGHEIDILVKYLRSVGF